MREDDYIKRKVKQYIILPLLLCAAVPLLILPRIVSAKDFSEEPNKAVFNTTLPTQTIEAETKPVATAPATELTTDSPSEETVPFLIEEPETAPQTTTETDATEISSIGETYDSSRNVGLEYQNGYTNDDLYCLAAVIYQEAGSLECSDQLQLMVASVVMNHVDNPNLPNTIREVLERDGAYGTMAWTGISLPEPTDEFVQQAIDRCYANARRVLEGERFVPLNVIYQAGFTQGSGIYDYIEGVYFCYE